VSAHRDNGVCALAPPSDVTSKHVLVYIRKTLWLTTTCLFWCHRGKSIFKLKKIDTDGRLDIKSSHTQNVLCSPISWLVHGTVNEIF
jgi:hypothetical protein